MGSGTHLQPRVAVPARVLGLHFLTLCHPWAMAATLKAMRAPFRYELSNCALVVKREKEKKPKTIDNKDLASQSYAVYPLYTALRGGLSVHEDALIANGSSPMQVTRPESSELHRACLS